MKRTLFYTILIIAIGALVVYRVSSNKSSQASPRGGGARKGPVSVSGIVVSPSTFSNQLSVSGTIDAGEQVQIRSQVSGVLQSLSFSEGGSVQKGQVLFRIDDSELRAQLSQVLTRESLAAETERRAGLLLQKEAISREEYDIALADLRSVKAQTQLIRAQLAKTQVRAPFSGRIGLRSVSAGEYLTPTTVVATLVSTNPVKLTLSVPEKYASQVRKGNSLSFSVAGSAQTYSASIYAIEPRVEESTRTLQLRARASNNSGSLIPGTFASIRLPLSSNQNALLIPTQAIIPIQNGKKVFIVKNGLATERQVQTSTRTDQDVLVTHGLQPGDTVLTTGILSLKAGSPVNVNIQAKIKRT